MTDNTDNNEYKNDVEKSFKKMISMFNSRGLKSQEGQMVMEMIVLAHKLQRIGPSWFDDVYSEIMSIQFEGMSRDCDRIKIMQDRIHELFKDRDYS